MNNKNKYQEALDNIKYTDIDSQADGYYQPRTVQDYNHEACIKMQELVDKATPKKPTYEGDGYYDGELVYDTWICPNCEKHYEVDYDEYDYCPNCGQKILWE